MNVQLPLRLDKPGFLDWVQRQEGRYELVGGRVVMMPGASRAHGILVMNVALLLRNQLDPRQWTVIADLGLDTGPESLRYPDIVVDVAGGGAGDYVATAPALLAEVLSPSSVDVDLGDKMAEYLPFPSLLAYLVFAQREPKAWVWSRAGEGFTPVPNVVAGVDQTIQVPSLRVSLPLAEVYAGIDLA